MLVWAMIYVLSKYQGLADDRVSADHSGRLTLTRENHKTIYKGLIGVEGEKLSLGQVDLS